MRWIPLFLCLAAYPALAGEFAVFASGSRLHADRHEVTDGKVRLYSGEGYIEVDASLVQGYEAEEPKPLKSEPQALTEALPPQAAPAPSPGELADAAADKYGLPRQLVRSVMAAESGFQPSAVSPKGAIGLMQLMPDTARMLGADPHDPAQNVDAGVRYLRDLLVKYNFGLRHALAAYNAGEGAVDKFDGVPPYQETLQYVRKIEKSFQKQVN